MTEALGYVPHSVATNYATRIVALEALLVKLWMVPPVYIGDNRCDTPDEWHADEQLTFEEMALLKEVLLRAGFCEWCWVGPEDECLPECEGER